MMQAHDILATAKHDSQLHHAACNFTKVPGTIYHLYERSNGTPYFSMLSPSEWGGACPHKFLGSYRLEHDHSWTPYEKIEARDRDIKAIDRAILARPSRRTWTNKSSIYNFIIISCPNSIIYALWCIWWEIKIPSLSPESDLIYNIFFYHLFGCVHAVQILGGLPPSLSPESDLIYNSF